MDQWLFVKISFLCGIEKWYNNNKFNKNYYALD